MRSLASKLDELTADTAKFLLDDVGTAKVFSLDTLDDLQQRADRIVKLRGAKAKVVSKPKANKRQA